MGKGRRRCNNQLMTDARAGCCHFGSTKLGPLTFSQIMMPKRLTAELFSLKKNLKELRVECLKDNTLHDL